MSLKALNERFRKAGKPEVKLVLVPDALEDEDMLEMLNAGLLQAIVVDDWKASMWAQVLPKVKVHDDIVLRDDDQDRLGDPQGQPEARGRARPSSTRTGPRSRAWSPYLHERST